MTESYFLEMSNGSFSAVPRSIVVIKRIRNAERRRETQVHPCSSVTFQTCPTPGADLLLCVFLDLRDSLFFDKATLYLQKSASTGKKSCLMVPERFSGNKSIFCTSKTGFQADAEGNWCLLRISHCENFRRLVRSGIDADSAIKHCVAICALR